MSDFSDTTQHVSPAASILENFHKKNGVMAGTPSVVTTTANSRQNLMNSSSSSSSLKETSSTSQQVVNSSSTTTRVEKKSQRLHHVTSSSLSSTSEMKATALQRDLNEIKNSMSEINDLALGRTTQPSIGDLKLSSSAAMSQLQQRIRSSLENLVDAPDEPSVTFPDDDDPDSLTLSLSTSALPSITTELTANGHLTVDTVKFEEKRTKSESSTKVITDGFSSEQATSNSAEMKRLQAGDIDYQEAKAAAAMRNRLEVDGVKTEQNAAIIKEAHSLRAGDVTQQASNNVAAASIKVQSDSYSAEKKAISQSQQKQTVTSSGFFNQEKHVSSASQSKFQYTTKGVSTVSSSQLSNESRNYLTDLNFDDLGRLTSSSSPKDIEMIISKYSNYMDMFLNNLNEPNRKKALLLQERAKCKVKNEMDKITQEIRKINQENSAVLDRINDIVKRAWAVPTHGHELGYNLCNHLRKIGGLDLLMKNCVEDDNQIKISSARLLEQCLTTENRSHVVENGLGEVVNVACACTKMNEFSDHSRVGTGILEHLFKHSEGTCSDVIKLGGLDAVLFECRTNDIETLRHCAGALANLSLYGGAENQEAMINCKVPMWLFPLAFHNDDNIKYYACLAIAVLVANKEIEAKVLKSGTLDLVEPFVTSHNPSEFAKSNLAHAHGQSKHWLQRLVPVLNSNREEARNLAAFHFCMEAGIKKEQGNTEIFREIGAIEPLKVVASCPNAVASKFAAQALRLIGEQVPHKLSQQVPLWSVEDVQEWVKQIGFGEYEEAFSNSKVDGDLLLKLNEDNLRDDISINNGILRQRFARELYNLKRMADYSSKDAAKINDFLCTIGPEYCTYTYSMLHAGVDRESLRQLNEDMLIAECGIKNSIHRLRILNAVRNIENSLPSATDENMAKTLDVFVSYRRLNGSQLASLLKVHLQLRGFSVFIDVERLEAGKFDNNLLNSIRQAKHFILVLTPLALDRCINDVEGKDWVHREIVAALNSDCNIIPIIDNFQWPEPEQLPEDMRSVCHFNAVSWSHDYQDACIDKLERFMRGEKNTSLSVPPSAAAQRQNPPVFQRMHSNDSDYSNQNGNVGGGQASRFRKSSSPARIRMGGAIGTGVGGGVGTYGRTPPRNHLLPPYRNQHLLGKTISGSLGNVGAGRRGSAAGIGNNRPPLPTTFGARSHSLDGLLDEPTVDQKLKIEDEQEENVCKREKSELVASDSQKRKSRSLDDLLNEIPKEESIQNMSTTQSMDELDSQPSSLPYAPQPDDVANNNTNTSTKPIGTPTPGRVSSRQSPEGMSSADDDVEEDDTQSNYSTASKDTGKSNTNKTFINRAVKKMFSLMKKPASEATQTQS